jgi:hypothetical protein
LTLSPVDIRIRVRFAMAVPSRLEALKLNDLTLLITGLYNDVDDTYLNAATVTATLYDGAGAAVSGFTSIGLSYIAASNGNYRGMVPESFNPALGDEYVLKIDAVQGSSVLHVEIPTSVRVRRA